jgi:hypothetical protein
VPADLAAYAVHVDAHSGTAAADTARAARIAATLARVLLPPGRPTVIRQLVAHPLGRVRRRRERRGELAEGGLDIRLAPLAHLFAFGAGVAEVLRAEVQPAAVFAAVGVLAADVREPAVDLLGAAGMVAACGHAVPDVALPALVVADRPAHQPPPPADD